MTSVRSSRTVYREDEEEGPQRRVHTTVKRYKVPDSVRSVASAGNEEVKEKIIVRRERIEDDRSSFVERPHREIPYRVVKRSDDDYASSFQEFREVDRETIRSSSPRRHFRVVERDRDFDIEKFTKSTEYYQQPSTQQIIIREAAAPQPIIIREERREPQRIYIRREEPRYEFVERREVEEIKDQDEEIKETASTAIVKAEEPEPPTPVPQQKPEEDYFYERRVITRRRRSSSNDRRTEVRPHDSASNYNSDDSAYEYERHERITEETDGRGGSPHHRRHLAEGALVGLGAAAILRNHRKKSTGETGHRGRDYLGGAAVGALGAEALSRVRSMRSLRRSSRSRSASSDYSRRDRKPRHRSHSRPRIGALGGIAAVAAVGALAGYALSNKGNKNETIIVKDGHKRRSRSRRRRASYDSYLNSPDNPKSARNPSHRNQVIAGAGLASAAAAGLWERFRSRSRGGNRSKSRIRQGIPIAAAGLGGAALAGLYERNKANKEAKKQAIIEDEMSRGRRRRSRSRSGRSRPASEYSSQSRDPSVNNNRGLIAYGNDPVRSASPGYYSDEEPGQYRRRGGSAGSSPDARGGYSRSRSRRRDLPEAGGYDSGRRRSRSRGGYDDGYGGGNYHNEPYARDSYNRNNQNTQQAPSYPGGTYFPPPPTGDYATNNATASRGDPYGGQQQSSAYPAYNPADYAAPQNQQHHGAGPYHGANDGYGNNNSGDRGRDPENQYLQEQQQRQEDNQRRGADDQERQSRDVPPATRSRRASRDQDGLTTPSTSSPQSPPAPAPAPVPGPSTTPRPRSSSRVRFDEHANRTREISPNPSHPAAAADAHRSPSHHRHKHGSANHNDDYYSDSPSEDSDDDDRSDNEHVENLPARFDKHGNPLRGGGGAGGGEGSAGPGAILEALLKGWMGGGGRGSGEEKPEKKRRRVGGRERDRER